MNEFKWEAYRGILRRTHQAWGIVTSVNISTMYPKKNNPGILLGSGAGYRSSFVATANLLDSYK